MTYTYEPIGTCSRLIELEIDDNDETIKNIKFTGGCMGNTQGVSKLCIGRKASEVIDLLKGIDCNGRGTSCPDQLATALEQALELM